MEEPSYSVVIRCQLGAANRQLLASLHPGEECQIFETQTNCVSLVTVGVSVTKYLSNTREE